MTPEQQAQNLKNVQASLEAHKGMLNESLQASLQLRTNLVHFQQALQESQQKVQLLEKQIADLTQKPEQETIAPPSE